MTKERKNKGLIILLLILVAVAVLGFVINKFKGKKGEVVYITKVEKRTIGESVLASGKIYPKKEVKISSDVSGEVVELYVMEGDTVKSGQLLARIDPDAYVSAVDRSRAAVNTAKAQEANSRAQAEGMVARKIQAEAQLEQLKAQFNNAQSVYDRNKELLKEGVISQAEFDTGESAYLSAKANVKSGEASLEAAISNYNSAIESVKAAGYSIKSAQAGLKEMNTSLQRTSIFAPMDGIVSTLNIEKGERVVGTIQMAGTEMMRVSEFEAMEAQVDVSETNVLQVSIGDESTIEIDAYPDKKFKGKVTEIGSSANNLTSLALNSEQVTNFTVKILVDPASYQDLIVPGGAFPLRPGMSASVEIFTHEAKDVISVPIQAVTTREKEDENVSKADNLEVVVFTVSGDTAAQHVVETGIQDDEYIQILSGISEGDEVIKGPYSTVSRKLINGMKLSVEDEHKKMKGR